MKFSNTQKKILEFAKKHHKGQVRKYTGEPYYNHLINVAMMVEDDGISREVALLHDILEDTNINSRDLYVFLQEFYDDYEDLDYVMNCVNCLSEEKGDLNRMHSKFLYICNMPNSGIVAGVKIADLVDNSISIKEHDPKFWKQFRMEAYVYLFHFRIMKDHKLYKKLKNILEK